MHNLSNLRERYSQAFIVELPDGQVVPFKLLSLADYFAYSSAFANGVIAPSVLENEICTKCVQDEVFVETLYEQKAGTPTVVADTILRYSAPSSLEELNYFFNYNRHLVDNVLYQIVGIICTGFPAYTPDDILAKDVHELFFLLALAERKLLESGILEQPIDFGGEQPHEQQGKERQRRPVKPKIDPDKLRQAYEEQEWNLHRRREKGQNQSPPRNVQENETPVFNDKNEDGETVISVKELAHNLNADPTTDSPEEARMIEEAKYIFGDYLEKLQKGEKMKAKTVDERMAEAKKRMAENRRKLREQLKGRK